MSTGAGGWPPGRSRPFDCGEVGGEGRSCLFISVGHCSFKSHLPGWVAILCLPQVHATILIAKGSTGVQHGLHRLFCQLLGGSENRMESSNTRFHNERTKVMKGWGTRNPQKSVLTSKVVNPFRRAPEPPFIGRRRDFYIMRLRSNLENIRGVRMYMNVFYIP
jgi:hypothetical protein